MTFTVTIFNDYSSVGVIILLIVNPNRNFPLTFKRAVSQPQKPKC